MTEDLISAAVGTPGPKNASAAGLERQGAGRRPVTVPEKFWDPEHQQLRTDALLKSYLELERKYSSGETRDVPERPEDYQIEIVHELIESDAEVNRRLHDAGFTQKQAQLVYDLAAERLLPMITEVASIFEAERQTEKLIEHFGGEARWRQVARQISAWGKAKLPEPVFEALSGTYEGVLTIHKMMIADEPKLNLASKAEQSVQSDSELKQMMRDPRYWRDQEPAVVQRVREGFRRLYND